MANAQYARKPLPAPEAHETLREVTPEEKLTAGEIRQQIANVVPPKGLPSKPIEPLNEAGDRDMDLEHGAADQVVQARKARGENPFGEKDEEVPF